LGKEVGITTDHRITEMYNKLLLATDNKGRTAWKVVTGR